jgi:predicted NUDIX family NTP pyrophosphohydrolase
MAGDRTPKTPRRVSAGILLFREREGRLEVLLGHPGGPFFAKKDEGSWTVLKGEADPGEELPAVARREFAEETGQEPPDDTMLELGEVRQRGGKTVVAWALAGDLDPAEAQSNTFEMEWPPRSGRTGEFPEIDRVGWFDLETARSKILPAQVPLLDRLGREVRTTPEG